MIQAHLVIHGRVQGVFYRQSTRKQATALGVTGWVRNRREGTVEVIAQGPADAIEALVHWCHDGPDMARVDTIERTDEAPTVLLEGFDVLPTD